MQFVVSEVTIIEYTVYKGEQMVAVGTALLSFYQKRKKENGAHHEITQLAEELKNRVIEVEPWIAKFFNS